MNDLIDFVRKLFCFDLSTRQTFINTTFIITFIHSKIFRPIRIIINGVIIIYGDSVKVTEI